MNRHSSTLHPFSRRVALWVGGLAFVAAGWAFVVARQRVPTPDELARRVEVGFAPAEADAVLTDGGEAAATARLGVRVHHTLPRPVGVVAFALGADDEPVWFLPPTEEAAPVPVAGKDAWQVVGKPGPRLAPGAWRLVTLATVGGGSAASWIGRWRQGEVPGRVVTVQVR